jgi:hypothetical protein
MNLYYTTKHELKKVRWQFRRWQTSVKWGSESLNAMPAVIGNAMPKSGSHLIIQVLQGLTQLGPFINTGFPPLNRSEDNRKLSQEEILKNIRRMKPGDITYSYLAAKEPYITELTRPGRASIFVYRDPRDMIVSHVFYATQIHEGHGMHEYYTKKLSTMEERINAAIQGVDEPGSELSPILKKYEANLGWFEVPQVLCLRFEDLILEQETALGQILDYLKLFGFQPKVSQTEAIKTLQTAIAPQRSGTFRKGKPGNWREHFTKANINLFKEQTGDLLIRMGYEKDENW